MIFHVDIDAFFASVEINKRKGIRHLPVIVCGKSHRTVVSSANYLARNYGIKAGISIGMATLLCPKVVKVFIDENSFTVYEQISETFVTILKNNFSKIIEQISIDECFLEIKNLGINKAKLLAHQMQKTIFSQLHLTVSIGIGTNKFLARMATQFAKPNNIFVLDEQNFKQKIWPLSIVQMFYIGKKIAEKLNKINIYKIGELANYKELNKLKKILGKNYLVHLNHANGICDEPIAPLQNNFKSISCEKTFASDIYEEQEFLTKLYQLCEKNYQRMFHKGLMCKTIHLKIKYADFSSRVWSTTLDNYTRKLSLIYDHAIKLFEEVHKFNDYSIRLVGISFSNLIYVSDFMKVRTLFDDHFSKSHWQLLRLINTINRQIGEHVLDFASNLLE